LASSAQLPHSSYPPRAHLLTPTPAPAHAHAPVDDVNLGPVLGQEVGLLHRAVPAANHGDGLVAEQGRRAVAHCARADALVPARADGVGVRAWVWVRAWPLRVDGPLPTMPCGGELGHQACLPACFPLVRMVGSMVGGSTAAAGGVMGQRSHSR